MRVEVPFLDLVAQHRVLREELLEVFSAALGEAAFVGGPAVAAFEADFAAFGGFRHVIALSNGTDALRIALQAMGIGAGARVVTVPNTFIATTEAVSHAGADFDFVDVDRATLDAIPEGERGGWLLQEKVEYAPALMTPGGHGVKVELRVLFLRPDDGFGLVPATNLCRLSRAKMHGVDYNKDFDWVGSSVALWAQP